MAGLPSGPRRAFRRWLRRHGGPDARRAPATLIGLALMVLLGGGPTLSAVCEAMCAGVAASGSSPGRAATHHSGHHHAPAHVHPASAGAHAAADHESREAAAAPAASSHDEGRTTIRLLDHGCCDDLIAVPASLAASPAAGQLRPSSYAWLPPFADALEIGNRRVAASAHGPPDRVPPIVRPPLVLRI